MSRRIERVNNLIRTIVSRAIQTRLNDPRIPTLTSVTHVEVSPDFSLARVFVSVMATPPRQKLAVEALQGAAGRLRALLAPELTMRHIPRLLFVLDESVQRAFETVQAIDQAMAELGEPRPWDQPAPPAQPAETPSGQNKTSLNQNERSPDRRDPPADQPARQPDDWDGPRRPPEET